MTAMSRREHSRIPVELSDRTLWMLLSALVAHRPDGLTPIEPGSRRAPHEIKSRVLDVERFAERVSALFLVADTPSGLGSARAVATAVVQLCHFFVHGWSHFDAVTDRRVAEFNREIEALERYLDGIAGRFVDGPH